MHWVGCELHLSGWASRHARSSIMTPGRGPAASARGRPRDPTLDARILDQVLALLASHGYAGLTLDELASRSGVAKTTIPRRRPAKPAAPGPARLAPDALASRSGVAKTTILRRWPSKAAVAAAGVERLALQSVDVPDSGALKVDLLALLHGAVEAFVRGRGQFVAQLIREAGHHPEITDLLYTVIHTRRQAYRRVLALAVARGELAPPGDQAAHHELLLH